MSDTMLQVSGLTTTVPSRFGHLTVIQDVSFSVSRGEIVGLVGESGSGKSMAARSILRLLPPGSVVEGSVKLNGTEVPADGARLRQMRGRKMAMIFQDARAHIDPFYRNGDHIVEGLRSYRGMSKGEARRTALELLQSLGIEDPDRVFDSYPMQLSGGMLQRVLIAGALTGDPELLIADEATTALDVTTQAEIAGLLTAMRTESRSVLFITHDLELAAAICDRIIVMYAGRIVEEQPTGQLFESPHHPYTAALVGARPHLTKQVRLVVIPGQSVSAFEAPSGCAFRLRCAFAEEKCAATVPPLQVLKDAVRCACLRADELDLLGTPAGEGERDG